MIRLISFKMNECRKVKRARCASLSAVISILAFVILRYCDSPVFIDTLYKSHMAILSDSIYGDCAYRRRAIYRNSFFACLSSPVLGIT